MSCNDRPRLRHVEAVHARPDDAEVIALFDPLGVAVDPGVPADPGVPRHTGEPILLSEDSWEVARHFDGERSLSEVAARVTSAEREVTVDFVRDVAAHLARCLLLEGENFDSAAREALDAFRALPVRPAAGAGRDYEPDAFDLRVRIGGLVANDWDMPAVDVGCMLTPAVDFRRAGRLYSRTYGCLRKRRRPERILLIGASRAPLDRLLVPLARPFDTLLGRAEVDAPGLAALASVTGRDELAHRDALVLERQLLFLRLILPDVPVVPVLVGALPGELPGGAASPAGLPDVEAAVAALRRVADLPGDLLIIAAADLAHVGSSTKRLPGLPGLRELDADCGDLATRLEPEALWKRAQDHRDSARARNMTTWYLALRLIMAMNESRPEADRLRGSVLGYEQLSTSTEVVSAASVAFH